MDDPILNEKPKKQPPQARCVECNMQPILLNQYFLNFPNGTTVSMMTCATCGAIIPHSLVGLKTPESEAKSKIITPTN